MTDDRTTGTDPGEVTLGRIETEVALLMRFGEATRRGTGTMEHRLLDRAAYVILRHLADAGPQNVSALAATLNLDGSTVTRQLSAMQRDGLIARAPDPTDGRGTVVSPTAAGLQRMAAVQAARTRLYGDILATWSPDDRDTLAQLLHRLNQALQSRPRPR
ncbi:MULTISPECIES: MarR family winged helix-turn-helix transcriptional regulator [Micromonospora]|uniref:MarR family transcriptional regulator n=1 Tax=Micromonospora sicca TaxID=2202420 RepID=A0ABU5JIN0_9ACTN|nr:MULTISPECIES: MarR family transcriptional regulator [unclassified Micromonospora]MBM0227984.1 MarR family transcriptional regulator [Micromonospora sp. ATA51]MDZ5445879.1 MarR family transcriptional regulator [Micromonospora sp. 4G57]MDZ5492490.1 MarR family transcriptional regulator [Micromonospora sp. 4G53]